MNSLACAVVSHPNGRRHRQRGPRLWVYLPNCPWAWPLIVDEGRVRRREFITLFCSAAAWPIRAAAQTQSGMPRVGYVAASAPTAAPHIFEAFRQRLRELGYVEGQTIAVDVRWAEGRAERISELVAELVGLKVDVLVVGDSVGALAAKKE